MRATVRLREVSPDTGGILLDLLALEERRLAPAGRPRRKVVPARAKPARERRVVRRR
jgi:hypothetical protein